MEQIKARKSVGKCKVDETGKVLELEREYFGQGMVFKDWDAYQNRPNDPCYVPELTDTVYTAKAFLEICDGQKEFADELFNGVDWQHPESLKEDWIAAGEWTICEKCGKLVNTGEDDVDICPYCGEKIAEDE